MKKIRIVLAFVALLNGSARASIAGNLKIRFIRIIRRYWSGQRGNERFPAGCIVDASGKWYVCGTFLVRFSVCGSLNI